MIKQGLQHTKQVFKNIKLGFKNILRRRSPLADVDLEAVPTEKMVLAGSVVSVVMVLILASFFLITISGIKAAVRKLSDEAELSLALGRDIESAFETRVAALRYRATLDATYQEDVAASVAQVLGNTELQELAANDPQLVQSLQEIHASLGAYQDTFLQLIEKDREIESILEEFSAVGRETRLAMEAILQATTSARNANATYRAAIVLEHINLGRYYTMVYRNTGQAEDLELARAELTEATTTTGMLRLAAPPGEPRKQAGQVRRNIVTLNKLLDSLSASLQQAQQLGAVDLVQIGTTIGKVSHAELEHVSAMVDEIGAAAWRSFRNTLIVLPFALLLSISLSVWASRFVARFMKDRLESLVGSTEALAGGDLDVKIKGAQHKHEVGRMAAALEVFREGELARRAQAVETAERQRASAEMLGVLDDGLSRLAAGDLTTRITTTVEEDYRAIVARFNESVVALQTLIVSVVETSDTLMDGTNELAQGAEALAARSESQAQALAGTSASVTQLQEMVDASAENAYQADRLVSDVQQRAAKGRDVVTSTVAAIDRIQSSSKDISQVLELIDGIVFQTNLLALNAGVEAARAGQAGAGFSVVALEVRALAQRAGAAANQIKGLVDISLEHVDEGTRLATETTAALSEIDDAVAAATHAVSEISTRLKEQAAGISDMSQAMVELDSLTQQNASLSVDTSAASSRLKGDARSLGERASVFQTEDTAKPQARRAA